METPERIFQNYKVRDPKISFSDNFVCLKPNYLNFSFVTLIILPVIFFPIYFSSNYYENFWVDKINLYFLVLIILFPIALVRELRYYNTVVVSYDKKIVSVTPGVLMEFFKKKKEYSFTEVLRIEPTRFSMARIYNRAFAIQMKLKNSDEIKILSVDSYNIAKEISERLSTVIDSVNKN